MPEADGALGAGGAAVASWSIGCGSDAASGAAPVAGRWRGGEGWTTGSASSDMPRLARGFAGSAVAATAAALALVQTSAAHFVSPGTGTQ